MTLSPLTGKISRWIYTLFVALLAAGPLCGAAGPVLPVTGAARPDAKSAGAVSANPSALPMTVSAPDLFQYQVVQQPSTNPGYVSTQQGTVTEFQLASTGGTLGLLAHNYLAGASFSALEPGHRVIVTYSDGSRRTYAVDSIHAYQALSPFDPYSNYVDLDHPGPVLTSTQVFVAVYRRGDAVVFQTCIARNGNSSWGRLFVTATPEQVVLVMYRSLLRKADRLEF